jgi:hypothetical protein
VENANVQRALATYAAMQHRLYLADRGSLYSETAPATGNPYAYVWPFSRALIGTLALAGMSDGASYRAGVQDRLKGLEWYWDGQAYASYTLFPYGDGGDRYSDDNAWVALALVQGHRMGLGTSLDRASKVFAFAERMWDRKNGGLFWVEQSSGMGRTNHDRGSGATAGHAELGFHLYELTHRDAYLQSATRMLNWVSQHFDASRTGNGPFLNAIRGDGSLDTNVWSYNQGVMIGALVQRYRLSGDAESLHLAERVARQALATFGDFTGQPPSFNAMCFQHMLMLHSASRDAELQHAMTERMRDYADWTWGRDTGARDVATDLFYFSDGGRPVVGQQPARLQDQGALLQLYALLAWDPADYHHLT